MQTSLDQPDIIPIYQFIKHAKASCLDLWSIFSKNVIVANYIQKIIIFVNSISDIYLLIYIIFN